MLLQMMNDNKGVISIFLILIMIPVMILSAILVDGSRMRSASMIVQEASDLAAMSVLTNYNKGLKDEFGLFALEDCDSAKLNEVFSKYLQQSLQANISNNKSYSDKVYEILKSSAFGDNQFQDSKFINLYDFSTDKTSVTPMYSLANYDVLQKQIIEYSKYRGIKVIAERLEILNKFQQIKEAMRGAEESNKLISEKYELDKDVGKVEEEIYNLKERVDDYNSSVNQKSDELSELINVFYDELGIILEDLYAGETTDIIPYNEVKKEIEDTIQYFISQLKVISTNCDILIEDIDTAIDKYEAYRQKVGSSENDLSVSLRKNAESDIERMNSYKNEILKLRNQLDSSSLISNLEKAKQAPTEIKRLAEKSTLEETIPDPYIFYNFDNNELEYTENPETAFMWYKVYFDKLLDNNYYLHFDNPITSTGKSMEGEAKEVSEKVNEKVKSNEPGDYTLTKAEADSRPSKSFDPQTEADSYGSIIQSESLKETDIKSFDYNFDKNNGENTVDNILSNAASLLGSYVENGRDEVLTYSYIIGTFKTRMTEKELHKDKPADITKPYITEWRYYYKDGEQDMRLNPKISRNTKFNSAEVEYIFGGQRSESMNKALVYSMIYSTRLANNLATVYLDKTANSQCREAAIAASAATMGTVPINVFHWIFMAAWAASETYIEMGFLIDKGYRIPLIKTSLLCDSITDIAADKEALLNELTSKSTINVCYEDYLIILMSMLHKNTRVMRVSDLIQLNMSEIRQSDFRMQDSFTYVRAETSMSIRYLFMPVKQFSEGYGRLSGRIPLKSVIYQGY